MARVRDMQGVSAQIVTLKSDGKRRHPAHCIYVEGTGKSRICDCSHNLLCYKEHCKSAAKCDYYEKRDDKNG